MSFGYVIDFACPPKEALGGAVRAASRLAEGARLVPGPDGPGGCAACAIAAVEGPGCVGVVATPLSVAAQRWLCERLPDSLETVAGHSLQGAIAAGFRGEQAQALRRAGKLAGERAPARSWGSFFRRLTVSVDPIVEQLLLVERAAPAHGLGVLVQLGAIALDGRVPRSLDEWDAMAALAEDVPARRARTQCTVTPTPSDESGVFELKRILRALHAAFCVDRDVLLFED
jgi:hypothetical protein